MKTKRPEYVNSSGANPSIETVIEACAISQEWADDARLAASRRHNLKTFLIAMAICLGVFAGWAVLLLYVFNV